MILLFKQRFPAFQFLLILFLIPLPEAGGKTVYVGPEEEYDNIMYGLTQVGDGDTVIVYSGTYKECIKINKRITLRGENIETTIVDGEGLNPIVRINADSVTICGFTIQNSSTDSGSTVKIYSKSNNIYENKIINKNESAFVEERLPAGLPLELSIHTHASHTVAA